MAHTGQWKVDVFLFEGDAEAMWVAEPSRQQDHRPDRPVTPRSTDRRTFLTGTIDPLSAGTSATR